jgi:hypothetical protein
MVIKMKWQQILKKDKPINELIDSVVNKLKENFSGDFMIENGDWDDEMEGYRDASDFTYKTLNKGGQGGEIIVEPSMEHEDDDEITTEFDINFEGYVIDYSDEHKMYSYDLRLGSYTGMDGVYFTSEDWDKGDGLALELLDELLE